jgi:integrase/recombinase XerC
MIKENLKQYLEDFSEYLLNLKNYSKLTVKTYYTPISEAINISEIYEEKENIIFDITKYRFKIAKQNPKTINKKLSSIRSFIDFLETKEIKIILKGSQSIKIASTLPKPVQTDNIFEALEQIPLYEKMIIICLYSFGLRISELALLKIEDIQQGWISVIGKGNKQRQIPSNSYFTTHLKEYLCVHDPKIYLFEKEPSKPLSQRQLQYKIEKSFKQIGIKVTPHQLRHSFASDLLNDGARINDISELLGHSSLKATGIYTKLNTNTKLKQYNMSHPLNKKVEDSDV